MTTAAKINHTNVLKVYDARKLNSNCSYFVMSAAGDGDLQSYLDRYYLSLSYAHNLLCQLLSGVAALHADPNNLVHRDIKPANLLILNDMLMIGDFGSVRQVKPGTHVTKASKHSILYRPPEAFGDNAYFDYSSDIYQVGLIGFLLFGGKISENLLDHLQYKERCDVKRIEATADQYTVSKYIDTCLQRKIQRGRLIDISALPCFVPRNIKRILRKSISSTSRYKTTCEFLGDLNNATAKLPDWIFNGESLELSNWEGKDFLLCCEGQHFIVKKRKTGAKKYQKDNSIGKSPNLEGLYTLLKMKLGLN